jgi:hypothetical protein
MLTCRCVIQEIIENKLLKLLWIAVLGSDCKLHLFWIFKKVMLGKIFKISVKSHVDICL